MRNEERDPARTLSQGLASLLEELQWADPDDEFTAEELLGFLGAGPALKRVDEFENTGLLTRDAGVLVGFEDGSEFQVTVVQSKRRRFDA